MNNIQLIQDSQISRTKFKILFFTHILEFRFIAQDLLQQNIYYSLLKHIITHRRNDFKVSILIEKN